MTQKINWWTKTLVSVTWFHTLRSWRKGKCLISKCKLLKSENQFRKKFIELENKTNPNGTLGGKKVERKKEATKQRNKEQIGEFLDNFMWTNTSITGTPAKEESEGKNQKLPIRGRTRQQWSKTLQRSSACQNINLNSYRCTKLPSQVLGKPSERLQYMVLTS